MRPLSEVPIGQIRGIFDRSNLHEPLMKYDFLLGLMDIMGPQAQLWACMGCGNDNFPNKRDLRIVLLLCN
jgi:hypothetical protein